MEENTTPTIFDDSDIPVEAMPDFSTETDTETESLVSDSDAVE